MIGKPAPDPYKPETIESTRKKPGPQSVPMPELKAVPQAEPDISEAPETRARALEAQMDFNASANKSGANKNSQLAYQDNKPRSLNQAFRILQCLRDHGPQTYNEIAAQTDIPRTSISGALGKLSGRICGPDGTPRVNPPQICYTGKDRETEYHSLAAVYAITEEGLCVLAEMGL